MSLKEEYATRVRAYFERTPYAEWLRDEGVAVYEGWTVPDVWKLETAPWPRLGGRACFITIYPQMEGQRGMYVVDIEGTVICGQSVTQFGAPLFFDAGIGFTVPEFSVPAALTVALAFAGLAFFRRRMTIAA